MNVTQEGRRGRRVLHSAPAVVLVGTLAFASVTSAGCTTLRPIPVTRVSSQPGSGLVKPGDRVAVVMRDGTHARFTVDSVEGDALVSAEGQRYARGDISKLSKHEHSLGKSLSLGVFVGCVAYHLAILAILAKDGS